VNLSPGDDAIPLQGFKSVSGKIAAGRPNELEEVKKDLFNMSEVKPGVFPIDTSEKPLNSEKNVSTPQNKSLTNSGINSGNLPKVKIELLF
jgi:hypothetical protein